MSRFPASSRLSIVALALITAACGDSSPLAPKSAFEVLAEDSVRYTPVGSQTVSLDQTCTVEIATGRSVCDAPHAPNTAPGVALDVVFADSRYFVLVKGAQSCANGEVDKVCTESNAVQNLLSQPIGVTNDGVVSGVQVILKSLSAAKKNGGPASISLLGGTTGSFSGITCTNNGSTVACPVMEYAEQVAPQATSTAKTWTFDIQASAETYAYTVNISVPLPVESGVVRWVWDQQTLASSDAFYGVFGRSNSEVFAAGSNGMIRRFNGSGWTAMTSGTTVRLNSVWANASTSDVFVAGFSNTMLRYNGTAWSPMTIPAAPNGLATTWYGVYGFSANNVFAVGTAGQIRRWDGSTWNSMKSPTNNILTAVWGSDPNNVYAVGVNGTILRWNGTTWATLKSGTNSALYSVWGNAAGTIIYASGRNGTLLRSTDGITWTRVSLPAGYASQYTWGMWGTGANDLYVATQGGTVLHYDGKNWRTQNTKQTASLYGMWGTSSTNMYGVGAGKTLARGMN